MDLVASAGIDVSDWAGFAGGQDRAASNPKYCYEWCFVQPRRVVVLNLWYGSMRMQDGQIVQEMNYRQSAEKYATEPRKPAWERRSRRTDEAIQRSVRDSLPVRVVVCDGEQRDINDDNSGPSRVRKRMLDPVPWSITAYDYKTGDCVVTRGAEKQRFLDQFDMHPPEPASPSRRAVSGDAFVRSAQIRSAVLNRADGYCEWCGKPGFAMPDGRVYLETHHVIPLSEKGSDLEENVVALCPNHHREAHYGTHALEMRPQLLQIAAAGL